MSDVAELTIDTIAAGGDGVGRSEGLVVFVPRTAPGDRASVRYAPHTSGRFARGKLISLTIPAPSRAEPPCFHYTGDRCGGCQLQHLTYEAQLDAKTRIVADALERIGRRTVTVPRTIASPRSWRYRHKLTLAMRRHGGAWLAGLHPFDAPGRIFALADCPITDARVMSIWREILAAGELLPRGPELRGAVRVGAESSGDGATFVLEGGRAWRESHRFFSSVERLTELWWTPAGRERRMLHSRGADRPPGAAFAQVNSEVAALIRRRVLEEALGRAPKSVIDAYAGTGEMAITLAAAGARVTAIELDPAAAAWCAMRLTEPSRAVQARVEHALAEALPADLVLLNPPRTGVAEPVTTALAAAPPKAIIYVSCNPATLARDLVRLPQFQIRSVQPFDMFPQTAHVETVCVLERKKAT